MKPTMTAWMLALVLLPNISLAQQSPACGSDTAVFGVSTEGLDIGATRDRPHAYIEDYITIGVCQLPGLLKHARESQTEVTLFMNGLDLGVPASRVDLAQSTLTFELDRTAANAAIWRPVLYSPFFDRAEDVFFSVGLKGGSPLHRMEGASMQVVFRKLWIDWTTWLWFAFLLAVVAAVIWFGMRTDMLREGPAAGKQRQPYSLGRVQMAAWFVLIVIGFVLIWIVTGDRDTVTPSLLVLAGISAATGLTAAVVTPRSVVRTEALRNRITEELAILDRSMLQLSTDLTAFGDRPQAEIARRLLAARQETRDQLSIELATVPAVFSSKGFWTDLVADDRGSVALDRVQIVVWTAVLVGLFVYSITYYLTMPEFNATMLGLMGISSGTYIGFKLPAVKA